jgi:hypothetical protein
MNELQQLAVTAATRLAGDLIRTLDDPSRGSIETRARAVVDQIDHELADMQSRSRLQAGDAWVADRRAADLQRELDTIEGEIYGAVAINDDGFASALMGQRDAIRIELDGLRLASATQHETEESLDEYISALQWLRRRAMAELTSTVAMARAAEARAAMAGSYQNAENLRLAINTLRDDAGRAFAMIRKHEQQIVEGAPDLDVGLRRERSRSARYSAEIESIRRRQQGG